MLSCGFPAPYTTLKHWACVVVSTYWSFPHSWLITRFVTRVTWRVPLVEQGVLTLPVHLSSPLVFSRVHVLDLLFCVLYFVDRCLFFCSFTIWALHCLSFDLCIFITPLASSNSSCGCDRMEVGFTSTYTISAYHHWSCKFESFIWRGILDVIHYEIHYHDKTILTVKLTSSVHHGRTSRKSNRRHALVPTRISKLFPSRTVSATGPLFITRMFCKGRSFWIH